jgi:very-short-patch-repair endonuclease
VLGFYCAKARLAIEIDGMSHDVAGRPERDLRRDRWLQARGITVMRMQASEVTRKVDEAADAIVLMAQALIEGGAPSTTLRVVPLPRRSGGG